MTATVGPIPILAPSSALELVWSDEFDGTTLNTSKWANVGTTYNYGDAGGGNQFAAINVLAQCTVSAGTLKILAEAGSFPTGGPTPNPAPWRSGQIEANFASGYHFQYGQRMEARVYCPPIKGVRPAIWTANRGGYPGYDSADADGELDMFEVYFNDYDGGERNQLAVIWDYSPFKQNNTAKYGAGTVAGWHDYACEWDDTIRMYRDGILLHTFTTWASTHGAGGPPTFPHPFQPAAPQVVIISFQIGGNYSAYSYDGSAGSQWIQPVQPGVTSMTMEVDYIRIYNLSS